MSLTPGIYAPVPTFFHGGSEEIDYETTVQHILRLAADQVAPVVLGSTGEATQLTHSERIELVRRIVPAVRQAGFKELPIIVGCGAGSTKETLILCQEAADAGATAVMVITPGYFAKSLDRAAIIGFFKDVCAGSKLPVFLYNYPGASAGIDLDSDMIIEIMESCPNAVGIKLTCGAVGKLTRLVAHPRSTANGGKFLVLNGLADHLLPSMSVGSSGAITGLANFCPKTCQSLYALAERATGPHSADSAAALSEATKLQGLVSTADWVSGKGGVATIKYILEQLHGYGGAPRRPLLPYDASQWPALRKALGPALDFEKSL